MIAQVTCPKCSVYNEVDREKCWKCDRLITEAEKQAAIKYAEEQKLRTEKLETLGSEEIEKLISCARETGDWIDVPRKILSGEASKIILTTSFVVAGHDIEKEIDIVTAEVVYGVNIFRDLFAGVRDIVGGRSSALQKVLKNSRGTVLSELRNEALILGADAVIAINLAYQEISGGGKSGMLMLVASGTAVTINTHTHGVTHTRGL